MDVIIFGGQSNMQGQTEGLPTENAPVEGAREYRFLTDELKPLAHPVGEDVCFEKWLAAAHEGGGSLVPAFCRAYVKATGREVVAIHAAKGSTTLAEWQRGTQHFYHAERKILAGLRKARETGTVDRVYYVWLQGESDAMIYTTEEEYYEGLLRYKKHGESRIRRGEIRNYPRGVFRVQRAVVRGRGERRGARLARRGDYAGAGTRRGNGRRFRNADEIDKNAQPRSRIYQSSRVRTL